MAHKHPAKDVEGRAEDLILAVNSALNQYYKKTHVDEDKRIKVSIDRGKGGKARTPEDQAYYLLQGNSWTANSSHMSDGAKHVRLQQGGKLVSHLRQLRRDDKEAFNVMANAWNQAMKDEGLRNFSRGKQFDWKGGDPLHMELPGSRLKEDDPRVIKTLEIYAKATRLEGKAKNKWYEIKKGPQFQKNWLQEYDLKLKMAKMAKGAKGPP